MKLRNKVLLTIAFALGSFFCLIYFASRSFLLQSFLDLETEYTQRNLYRAHQALEQLTHTLTTITTDWAHWNDAYAYMQGQNPKFVSNNLTLPSYLNAHIDFLGYYRRNGKAVINVAIDAAAKKFIPIPAELKPYLSPQEPLLQHSQDDKSITGYLGLPSGIMLVASVPVLTSDQTGPSMGVLVTGRYLTPAVLREIAETTHLNIQLFLPQAYQFSPALQGIFQATLKAQHHYIDRVNSNLLKGYSLLRDIYQRPIGLIQIEMQRDIYQDGLKIANYYLGLFALCGFLLALLLWQLLHKLVTRRLEDLDSQIKTINNQQALSYRIKATGNDEISSVTKKVNQLLNTIQTAQEQLEQRVQQRTEELQQTNLKLTKEIDERVIVEKQLIAHKEHLDYLAHYDNLTGLPNRVFFNDTLNKELNHAKRHHQKIAILFIDLNRFKKINDALGHHMGDEVIKKMAKKLRGCLRAEDVLARLSGDEFILFIRDITTSHQVILAVEKILKTLEDPIIIDQHEFFLGASIGISIYPDDGQNLETLQKNADMAMYKAKKKGGSAFYFYTAAMNQEAQHTIRLETDLRKAISNNELRVFYQPKFSLATKNIVGVEALVRWEHSSLGLVYPNHFIGLAEETGLILPIGEWVLQKACQDAKLWQQQGHPAITVSVNLSPIQFRHQNLATLISATLQNTGLACTELELEITENAMMDDIETAINKLAEIRELGVTISVDDFGTGYSSINYLKKLPINLLKIDKSFIKGIPNQYNDNCITTAIIALAHSLGLRVVAEGIETLEQLQFLSKIGCDIGQGYFLSKPMLAEDLVTIFQERPAWQLKGETYSD